MTRARPSAGNSHDLIVFGAGPAGAAAAVTAARAGLTVALIDKHRFPRDKLCGGGLTQRAYTHFSRIFQAESPAVPTAVQNRVEFHAFGTHLATVDDVPPLRFIMRRDFDAALMQRAISAGAEDFTGHLANLEISANGASCRLAERTITAPLVIAADGVNSAIARQLFGSAFDRNTIGFALEVECPDIVGQPLRIDFGAADWGYGWQFPKTCGTTIGLGGVLSRNKDMKAALSRYLSVLNVTNAPAPKGQFLPFGTFRKSPGQGRVLFAGAAAGLVDPITGEGIAHALHSGELAALAAATALTKGAPDSALPNYQLALWPVHSGLRNAALLRNLMFRPSLRGAFVRGFKGSTTLRNEYLKLISGETEYAPLMHKTLRRLPNFLWRSLAGK